MDPGTADPSGSAPRRVRLAPLPAERLPGWIASSQADYVDDLLRAGEDRAVALVKAARAFEDYFAGGAPPQGHHVYDVIDGAEPVGSLWLGPQPGGSADAWWVWDITIDAGQRGRGLGRLAMTLAEDEVRRHGGTTLGLSVFGFNAAARGLYASLGYQTRSIQMFKTLEERTTT